MQKCVAVYIVLVFCPTVGFRAAEVTFTDTVPDCVSPSPAWIEGAGGKIIMSYRSAKRGEKLCLAESSDAGRSWRVFNRISYESGYGYMTRLADGKLVMVVSSGWGKGLRDLGWIASTDEGRTWSKQRPIPIDVPHLYPYGPITEMSDGRWAYCPYFEEVTQSGEHIRSAALLVWSKDQGKTWSKPIEFPHPVDGNKGLTEAAVIQTDPDRYFAAIRADEMVGAWDGFYWSESSDGLKWTAPKPFGDIGRMPLFYRIGDKWVLTYRQYVPAEGAQYGVLRLSSDGNKWSKPHRLGKGVDAGPFLTRVGNKLIALNRLYPNRNKITRREVDLNKLD
ncbi:MAG: exo-alpha-sialidase [Pirellulales bacterium]|nr:exo-alpha-sialidase [Pirellulales bacterium]